MKLKQIMPVLNFIKKNNRPILTKVLVDDDFLTVTDLETYIQVKNSFSDDGYNFFKLENGVHNLVTLGADGVTNIDVTDYPSCSFSSDFVQDTIKMSVKTIDSFTPFVSKDETRIHLMGVAINDNHLVATDGHCLKKEKLSQKVENDYIIPSTSLLLLKKLMKKFKVSEVDLKLDDSFFYVETSDFKVSSRLINREYPKWQGIMPKKTDKKMIIDNLPKFKDIKNLFNSKNFCCELKLKDKIITMKILNKELNSEKTYKIGECGDEEMQIGVNFKYLDKCVNGQKTVLDFNNELSPILFNNDASGVIMPLKI